jgi:hypothetical protein
MTEISPGLETSASTSNPSKKSEIERGCADAVRGIAAGIGGGQWMTIAFMGHVELTGYVTEITLGGQAAFHIDLPEKLWGGNPMAWQEYAATALYSRRPVSEESVRKSYEARLARQAAYERQQAELATRAIEPGDGDAWCGGRPHVPGEAEPF